ncbi:GIY-YIG nuclease family protein [Rosenbergiella epipactidis]|uniref:GIY-YIG nuclease family protein n=1 Tax=Rosenbergiella epipactidis TaxID=1544694 RepID=UPI001F4F255E|nr:GIY-YIG nuclease family protein [Rosenbergiella epipactidis]
MEIINLTDSIGGIRNIEMSKVGHVYILEDVKRGMVKIGRSQNPIKRLDTIRTSAGIYGGREYVTHRVEDSSNLELSMHNIFSSCRLNGEWFEVNFDKVVSALELLTPKQLDDEKYEKARIIARNEAEKSAEGLMRCFLQPEKITNTSFDHNDQISFIISNLLTIKKYSEIQKDMFQSLGSDVPRLSGLSGGFSDINGMVVDLINQISSFGKFLNSTLSSMSSDEAKILSESILRQLPEKV